VCAQPVQCGGFEYGDCRLHIISCTNALGTQGRLIDLPRFQGLSFLTIGVRNRHVLHPYRISKGVKVLIAREIILLLFSIPSYTGVFLSEDPAHNYLHWHPVEPSFNPSKPLRLTRTLSSPGRGQFWSSFSSCRSAEPQRLTKCHTPVSVCE
jgi:hypothetical protein